MSISESLNSGSTESKGSESTSDGTEERSLYTVVVYLNDDYTGGDVSLMDASGPVLVKSVTGSALIFTQDGGIQRSMVHTGTSVQDGVKFILRTDLFYRRTKSV